MKEKILLIVNPVAGRGNIKKDVDLIQKNFENLGYAVNTAFTTPKNNGEKIVKDELKDEDIVVAVGGDGTLNEVVNGITKNDKKAKVAFIPFGTTNDFARTLNISTNKFHLSKNINNAKPTQCDTGSFNGKYFNYVSAFGTFSKTSYDTDRKEKNMFGRLAYLRTGTHDFIFNDESYHMKINIDGEIIEGDFEYGSISNSKFIGGFQLFKEDEISVSDGKFEVILIKKTKNKAELLGTYTKLLVQVRNENVIYRKASNIEIIADEPMNWSLDGEEEITDGKVKISNLNNNISVLVV